MAGSVTFENMGLVGTRFDEFKVAMYKDLNTYFGTSPGQIDVEATITIPSSGLPTIQVDFTILANSSEAADAFRTQTSALESTPANFPSVFALVKEQVIVELVANGNITDASQANNTLVEEIALEDISFGNNAVQGQKVTGKLPDVISPVAPSPTPSSGAAVLFPTLMIAAVALAF